MDRIKDIKILMGWEFYDYLTPLLPKFFRYRVLFFDWVLNEKAGGDLKKADKVFVTISDSDIRNLYAEFYNLTIVGKENPITPEMVKEIEHPSKEQSDFIRNCREDWKAHVKDRRYFTEKNIEEWKEELMS